MSKTMVTRLFLGAIVAIVAGWVLAVVAVVAALASGAVVIGGPNVLTVNGAAFASALVVLIIAVLLEAAGGLAAVTSWIGALVATSRLEDKTWFALLLVLGLWSFGLIAVAAYLIAGPDSRREPGAAGVAAATGA